MTAFSHAPETHATRRLYTRHARYSRFDRLNYSKQEMEFLDAQASRLSRSDSQLFTALKTYTAEQIVAATLASHIGL